MTQALKLFHLFDQNFEQIKTDIERSGRKTVLQQSISVYEGAGRFAILSNDDELDGILNKAGCKELSRESLMVRAIAREPEVFQFNYGNINLAELLN